MTDEDIGLILTAKEEDVYKRQGLPGLMWVYCTSNLLEHALFYIDIVCFCLCSPGKIDLTNE